jgi:hypothetical protein
MRTLTKTDAIAMAASGWWKDKSAREVVAYQLFQPLLCMDFGAFHEAVEKALGRSVWTHEFASGNSANLEKEFLGEQRPPTEAEIFALAEKLAPGRVMLVEP